ncbi:hypothetical protein S7711_01821 [Stachybotrys chartarum IBT 7711]|uniref:Protein kinase domain-containing protein n=1 Tax=Stachybotrys chartarum (strain CBS 109288 / IBT 7711) TaxID=1280523 RepID=A0A084AJ26_STACB|nr:hypothetical protein S7711_01821 [Stachybotrys chartarum IBT 7711]
MAKTASTSLLRAKHKADLVMTPIHATPSHMGRSSSPSLTLGSVFGYSNDTQSNSLPRVQGSRMLDVRFLSIYVTDIESKNDGTVQKAHVGVSVIDTQLLHDWTVQRRKTPTHNIASYHFVVGELNQPYAKIPGAFLFGKPEFLSTNQLQRRIGALFLPGKTVVVSHGSEAQVLKGFGIYLESLSIHVLNVIETAERSLRTPYGLTLGSLMTHLDIPHARLHVAGNGAQFMPRALLLLAVVDAKELPGHYDLGFRAIASGSACFCYCLNALAPSLPPFIAPSLPSPHYFLSSSFHLTILLPRKTEDKLEQSRNTLKMSSGIFQPPESILVPPALLTRNDPDQRKVVIHTIERWSEPTVEERWRVGKVLGSGKRGTIVTQKCIEGPSMNKIRVVKQLPKPWQNKNADSELRRKLSILRQFSQPEYKNCFVKFQGWYELDSNIYFVMEYMNDSNLNQYLRNVGPLFEQDAKYIARRVLKAIKFMHESGIAHGDIHPANILVRSNLRHAWWVRLSNFGLGHHYTSSLDSRPDNTAFMPPEYYRFGPSHTLPALEVAKASDIWGIGQTLHVSLTRELIFKADLWRLEAYGCEEVPFPDHILTGHGISKASIEFLSELMAATPVHRLSVTEALAHDWCTTPSPWIIQRSLGPPLVADAIPSFYINWPEEDMSVSIDEGTITLEDTEAREIIATWRDEVEYLAAATSPCGVFLIVLTSCAHLLQFEFRSLKLIIKRQMLRRRSSFCVGLIAFSPDGRNIAVTLGEHIFIVSAHTGIISDRRCEFTYRSTIRSMAFRDLGYIVCATGTALFTTQLCGTPGGLCFVITNKLKYLAPGTSTVVSEDGTRAAHCTRDYLYLAYDGRNFWSHKTWARAGTILSARFSPDGDTLMILYYDSVATIYLTASDEEHTYETFWCGHGGFMEVNVIDSGRHRRTLTLGRINESRSDLIEVERGLLE